MGPGTAREWAWGGTHVPSATLDLGLGPHQPWVLSVPHGTARRPTTQSEDIHDVPPQGSLRLGHM